MEIKAALPSFDIRSDTMFLLCCPLQVTVQHYTLKLSVQLQ